MQQRHGLRLLHRPLPAAAATGESLVTRTCVLEDMNSQCGQFKFQVTCNDQELNI